MIVADTSALIAVAANEPFGPACIDVLDHAPAIAISAATLTEALLVANRFNAVETLEALLRGLSVEVVAVDEAEARRVRDVYVRWGRGFHPAKLNWGDCYSYSLAQQRACPLLYIGEDFAMTDIQSALDVTI